MTISISADLNSQYEALTQNVGIADLGDRTQIELTGNDRSSFLHNLCTNDVRRLESGQGCEAFFCNVQGKILAFVYLFRGSESIVLETVPGQNESLLAHLDRYLIREDVQLHDRSDQWGEMLVAGDESESLLADVIGQTPNEMMQSIDVNLSNVDVSVRRVPLAGNHSFLLSCERAAVSQVADSIQTAGASPCGGDAVEIVRVEAGTPYYGRDISDTNLPQEVNRDGAAISFVKGCYLGQETVARIDALGHVNWTLVGLKFVGDTVPETDSEILSDEKVIGRVTSAVFSPQLDSPLAMAYVRRGHNELGTKIATEFGEAEVVRFPLSDAGR